jgi:hypothetical protein
MRAEPDDLEVRAADTLALQSDFERREISWRVSAFQAITSAESAVPQIWPVRNMSTDLWGTLALEAGLQSQPIREGQCAIR